MTAPTTTIRTACSEDADDVMNLCIDAFADEAVIAWLIPDSGERQRYMRQTFGASLGDAIAAEAVILAVNTDGELMAASMWLPQVTTPQEAKAEALVDELAGGNDLQIQRMNAIEAATSTRTPKVPHLKLSSMATLPKYRGQGAGSAMLAAGIERARNLQLPIYLEASTSDNRRLYERLGFCDLGGQIHLPDGGPSLQPMWLETGEVISAT